MPSWMKYDLDQVSGSVYTCVNRDSSLMDTTKSVWFQGRFGFIVAFAYNHMDKNSEQLSASKSCIDFIERHYFDTDGHMCFGVTGDGRSLRRRRYVFSECSTAIAMSEYVLTSSDRMYAGRAPELPSRVLRFITTPGILPPEYRDTPSLRGHSIAMILINTASRMHEAIDSPILTVRTDDSLSDLKTFFMHPESNALLETTRGNGEFIGATNGRIINPGHCTEATWFILKEPRHRGQDKEILEAILTVLDWSWEWGWDEDLGGTINSRDYRNLPVQNYSQDMKFWWPQTEAVITTLYVCGAIGDEKYLRIHNQVSNWTYAHLLDEEYGEQYGYPHHDGSVAQPAKGDIFKGSFHTPRMMIKGHVLCNETLSGLSDTENVKL